MARLGSVPDLGATVEVDGCLLSVTAMDGRRIARIRVSPGAGSGTTEDSTAGRPSSDSATPLPQ
jgi:Hemolysins and related proteins containing CBS domains